MSLALSSSLVSKLPSCALHFIVLLLSSNFPSDCLTSWSLIRLLLRSESTNPRFEMHSPDFALSLTRICTLFVLFSWISSPSSLLFWRHSKSSSAFNRSAHCARVFDAIALSSISSLELYPSASSGGSIKLSSLELSSAACLHLYGSSSGNPLSPD